MINPPADFLANSDSVCRYGKLVLIPAGKFNSWHWSTGENSSFITIKEAGNYSLTVTDQNGCKATEFIQVFSKDCLTGVYVPNAFTPNRDGHNDSFKALVYGPVSSFSLQIYNRYGEIVFTSNDPEKGWDGFYKGKPSDNGNYVWTCRYQFTDGEKTLLKGNLVLLR
jgi:gliding motility-associated-like protein